MASTGYDLVTVSMHITMGRRSYPEVKRPICVILFSVGSRELLTGGSAN
jgi:hypothetical protein